MLPDIDSLALFTRAAELNSLTKAAAASNISLAAASRRIALLENRFKTSLLERSPRGVELTAAGAALLDNAKALLMQMNKMQAEMSDYAVGRKGALRILANTSAMSQFLPGDLAGFSASHPDVRLVVGERWSPEIARAVMAADADIGIIVEGIEMPGLALYPYRTDKLATVMPMGHPLTELAVMMFDDVLAHDVVGLEGGSSMMRLLTQQAVVSQRTLQLRIEVRSFEAVCRFVQSGLGVGFLPQYAAEALAREMKLVVRPLMEPWAERRMQVCVRKDHAPTRACMQMVDHLTSRTSAP